MYDIKLLVQGQLSNSGSIVRAKIIQILNNQTIQLLVTFNSF